MSVHVRWPARPAEHRAGLEFSLLLSLFQDKESKENTASRQKEQKAIQINLYLLSFACAKESNKEKHRANDVRPLAPP